MFTLGKVDFLCSQHCQNMNGSFNIQLPPTQEAPFTYTRAINYRTEPLDYRYATPRLAVERRLQIAARHFTRAVEHLVLADPQTPIFAASNNMPVRFRLVHPAGATEQVFTLHGHVWQEEPYMNGSREIGNNPQSQSQGSRDGFGPNVSFDAVIDQRRRRRRARPATISIAPSSATASSSACGAWCAWRRRQGHRDDHSGHESEAGGRVLINGSNTVNPGTGQMAKQVTIFNTTGGAMTELGTVEVDPRTGAWPMGGEPFSAPGGVRSILVRSAGGGEAAGHRNCRAARRAGHAAASA